MKEATFIYKPVQNEAHINSLEFHIGASNRIEADIRFENL